MLLHRISRTVMIAGLVLLAAVAAAHLITARSADATQVAMADEWAQLGAATSQTVTDGSGRRTDAAPAAAGEPIAPLDDAAALARVEVRRPGAGPLLDGPFYVGEGIAQAQIDRGPSHYPASALPGHDGNFAVAGHRTMHGAPFGDLDEVRHGDEVLVTDRAGRQFLYRVAEQRIVSPTDTWVVDPDPLGRGTPTLTFTTCHPRYSARQRLVVWAELVPHGAPDEGQAQPMPVGAGM
ncbi:MAG: sortase [Actinobacteria bacterium]|nr:sortase [Actinomycetota bacterium]